MILAVFTLRREQLAIVHRLASSNCLQFDTFTSAAVLLASLHALLSSLNDNMAGVMHLRRPIRLTFGDHIPEDWKLMLIISTASTFEAVLV